MPASIWIRYWKSGERELFGELYQQAIEIMKETEDSINEWLRRNGKPE